MADVFLSVARGQMGVNKLAVVKRLRQALVEEKAFRNMFLDEARLAARLSHPNIVHTYEVGEQDGVYFIAMEYLEGQSLNKVLKEAYRRSELIDPAISVRIVADALAGLGYAHELRDYDGRPLGVIHRDVSPHNIFVTYDGHTKLVKRLFFVDNRIRNGEHAPRAHELIVREVPRLRQPFGDFVRAVVVELRVELLRRLDVAAGSGFAPGFGFGAPATPVVTSTAPTVSASASDRGPTSAWGRIRDRIAGEDTRSRTVALAA
jgi:serine/threonine protein kinase